MKKPYPTQKRTGSRPRTDRVSQEFGTRSTVFNADTQSDRTRPAKKYNPYGEFFVLDRIDLKKIVEELVGVEEIPVSGDIDILDDQDVEWVDDRS